MWLGLPDGAPDVLDIGIKVLKPGGSIRTLYLYVPAEFSHEAVGDLSAVMKSDKTLTAVFNEILSVGAEDRFGYEVVGDGIKRFRIAKFQPAELTYTRVHEEDGVHGTVVEFGTELFNKFENSESYLRLRLHLDGKLERLFASEVIPQDSLFLSSFFFTEIVEFRINEKRNFSDAFRKAFPRITPPRITAIHYFLVRDIHAELFRAHEQFRKMRRLEPNLWGGYLKELGSVKADNMIIYHWKREPNHENGETSVENLIALSSFRFPRQNIFWYIIGIVLLGALGNQFQAVSVALASPAILMPQIALQLCIMLIFLLLFVAWFLSRSVVAPRRKRKPRR